MKLIFHIKKDVHNSICNDKEKISIILISLIQKIIENDANQEILISIAKATNEKIKFSIKNLSKTERTNHIIDLDHSLKFKKNINLDDYYQNESDFDFHLIFCNELAKLLGDKYYDSQTGIFIEILNEKDTFFSFLVLDSENPDFNENSKNSDPSRMDNVHQYTLKDKYKSQTSIEKNDENQEHLISNEIRIPVFLEEQANKNSPFLFSSDEIKEQHAASSIDVLTPPLFIPLPSSFHLPPSSFLPFSSSPLACLLPSHGKKIKEQFSSLEKSCSSLNSIELEGFEGFSSSKYSCPSILVVYDNPFKQLTLELILKSLNLRIVKAKNGLEAIEILKKAKSNCKLCEGLKIVFMDFEMPVMNGIEFTKKIRELIFAKEIEALAIIGCTAHGAKSQLEEFVQAGIDDLLVKPINIGKIKTLIGKWRIQV